jgi:hypothetical protein
MITVFNNTISTQLLVFSKVKDKKECKVLVLLIMVSVEQVVFSLFRICYASCKELSIMQKMTLILIVVGGRLPSMTSLVVTG